MNYKGVVFNTYKSFTIILDYSSIDKPINGMCLFNDVIAISIGHGTRIFSNSEPVRLSLDDISTTKNELYMQQSFVEALFEK